MSAFSERLCQALVMRNMTAAELSRVLNINEGTISQYKKGLYEPKYERLKNIAEVLNVTVEWLLGEVDSLDNPYLNDDDSPISTLADIGKRIKFLRMNRQVSIDQIAQAVGKDRATIYRYEKGDINKMPINIIEPLAEVLHTTPSYLMGWSDDESGIIETIGQRLLKLRIESNLSQTELANTVRISKQTLYKYENDIIENIPYRIIERLAMALHSNPSYIIGWESSSNVMPTGKGYQNMDKANLRITSVIDCEPYKSGTSPQAKLLFVTLCELEARFTRNGVDWFFFTDEELAEIKGDSISTIKKYKRELKNVGLISTFSNKTQKTGYRLLKYSENGFFFERRKKNG